MGLGERVGWGGVGWLGFLPTCGHWGGVCMALGTLAAHPGVPSWARGRGWYVVPCLGGRQPSGPCRDTGV